MSSSLIYSTRFWNCWDIFRGCGRYFVWYNIDMEGRREKVKQAIANEKLEGLNISRNTKKTLDEYVAGKISAKEAAQQVYARYGVK